MEQDVNVIREWIGEDGPTRLMSFVDDDACRVYQVQYKRRDDWVTSPNQPYWITYSNLSAFLSLAKEVEMNLSIPQISHSQE